MIAPQPIIQDEVLPAVRSLLNRYPLAAGCSLESLARRLFVMRYLDELPTAFAVETALEVLRLDSGEVAA